MATVKNTILLQDKFTPVLGKMMKSMQSTVDVMAKMDNVSNSAFKKVQQDVKMASDSLDDFSKGFDPIPPQQQRVNHGFKTWQKAIIVANQGLQLFKGTLGKLGLIDFDRAFGRMDTMKNFERTLGIITGNTDAAKLVMGELNDAVLGTAYGLDTAAKSAQNFITRGAGLKQSVNYIKTWSDAVAFYGEGTDEQLSSVTDALGKMLSKGKVEMYQLNRLTDAGINAVDMYAKAVGRDVASVQKDLSSGVISSYEFIESLTSAMEEGTNGVLKVSGAAKEAGATWATTFANMKAAGARGLIGLIENIDRALEALGFNPIMENLRNIGQQTETLFKNIGTAIYEFVETNKERILFFYDMVRDVISFIGENLNLIPPILAGIGTAYITASIGASIYAIAQSEVNKQLFLMNIKLLAAAALIAGAIYLWNEFGIAGRILAVALGVLAGVIIVATIAQHAFNTALWACPIVWIIALIVALIGIIVVLVLWIIDLWKTNLDFKYGVIKIWNDILNFFDQVPIFFQMVGYGIVDAFGWAKVQVLQIMESMGNGVIKIINNLISALNKIPGVALDPLNELTFAASAAAEAEAKKQSRANNLQASRDAAAAKKAAREAEMISNRAIDEANLAAQKAKAESSKDLDTGIDLDKPFTWDDLVMDEPDFNLGNIGGLDGGKLKGGKLDSIGRIEDDVSITEDDLKLLKDVAIAGFTQQFTTLRPEMVVNISDVKETADVGEIMTAIETMVEEAYASTLVGE